MIRPSWSLLLLVAACGSDVPRAALATRRAVRTERAASAVPDTAVFVARQAGEAGPVVSAVMQLEAGARLRARGSGGRLLSRLVRDGELGVERADIPGSRAASVALSSADSLAMGWRATVRVPVLQGERYLLELLPASPRSDSVVIGLSADGRPLAGARVAAVATPLSPALFEVAIGAHGMSVSPQIDRVDVVPTCGTTHVVRSAGRADLYAQYEVVETHERGDVHLPPRADDAQYRAVTFRTRTRGAVRITYLGRELAMAARPEGCPF
jgi:hypothetical protein